MKVKVTLFNGEKITTSLYYALKPSDNRFSDGMVEEAREKANKAIEMICRMLERMVDIGLITLDDAKQIAECHEDIQPI